MQAWFVFSSQKLQYYEEWEQSSNTTTTVSCTSAVRSNVLIRLNKSFLLNTKLHKITIHLAWETALHLSSDKMAAFGPGLSLLLSCMQHYPSLTAFLNGWDMASWTSRDHYKKGQGNVQKPDCMQDLQTQFLSTHHHVYDKSSKKTPKKRKYFSFHKQKSYILCKANSAGLWNSF